MAEIRRVARFFFLQLAKLFCFLIINFSSPNCVGKQIRGINKRAFDITFQQRRTCWTVFISPDQPMDFVNVR